MIVVADGVNACQWRVPAPGVLKSAPMILCVAEMVLRGPCDIMRRRDGIVRTPMVLRANLTVYIC